MEALDGLDLAFPPGECDDRFGEHYQQTGHFMRHGVCVSCKWADMPADERKLFLAKGGAGGGYGMYGASIPPAVQAEIIAAYGQAG